MVDGGSFTDIFFTINEYAAQKNAAPTGSRVAHVNESAQGSRMIMAPTNPVNVANQRAVPTFSLSNKPEPTVANNGEVMRSAIPCQIGTG